MTNIRSIAGGKQSATALEPNTEIVETLQRLLADAQAGQIQHLVAVYTDGRSAPVDLYQGSGEPWHVVALIGGMELCKHTMLMTQYQENPA